ncbi:DUF1697 domain-containing protein [Undibacterium seohonense]|uniref:DUF1697 domain-containing protein n=1 Tax=Undibacterium seohonense TaxID=1344950 RepID=A0ABR6X5F1_9BURK|nr:DUF1697 domain-containing protein [Undibacterium seohonense]MBC3808175.1 DUF1697 domain-containing protein [Undibacterium seohonense]
MTAYIAFLRAVNVGGTGKLPMKDLVTMCEAIGFQQVKTYIASGNVIFSSMLSAKACQDLLEKALADYAGKTVGVFIRTPEQIQNLLAQNPFADKEGNRSICLFLDEPVTSALIDAVKNKRDEVLVCGEGAIYVYYGAGMADSKLLIPAAKNGTARNINTVSKLCQLGLAL